MRQDRQKQLREMLVEHAKPTVESRPLPERAWLVGENGVQTLVRVSDHRPIRGVKQRRPERQLIH